MQWEYHVEDLGEWDENYAQEFLNKLGEDGWELVHVSYSLRTYFFKRPKQRK